VYVHEKLVGGSPRGWERHTRVCSGSKQQTRATDARWRAGERRASRTDPAEQVALVASARRELLLRVHRHRLRWEDLEDCYSQATLELIAAAHRGTTYSSRSHLANVIEQRFVSRIRDRRRALSGRSPMQAAIEAAVPLGAVEESRPEIVDPRADPERLVILREQLREVQAAASALSPDQQIVLAAEIGMQMPSGEVCRRVGWSGEKYRKVRQRARSGLRRAMADDLQV
jgi:RNA polymerase sigma factor (sigma-70 family)